MSHPTINEPSPDVHSLRLAVSLIKEAIEIMNGLRGNDIFETVVTGDDLVELGVITKQDWEILKG